jgi:molybdenum cofactor synthesis domain-containing protein
MPNPTAAMLVIGDEILSGRTRDANVAHLAAALNEKGIDLHEARIVRDAEDAIIAALDSLRTRYTHVFTSGGIGPTHDDVTADAVARAFGVPIEVRADARAILASYYAGTSRELNEARLRMARVPDGAVLIDNPVSGAPGFSMGNVHVMAGVPEIFQAMLEGLLARLIGGRRLIDHTVHVALPEGEVAERLRRLSERHPAVSIGSYPVGRGGVLGCTLVLRSQDPEHLAAARTDLGRVLEELRPPS